MGNAIIYEIINALLVLSVFNWAYHFYDNAQITIEHLLSNNYYRDLQTSYIVTNNVSLPPLPH